MANDISVRVKNAIKDNTSPYGNAMPPQKLSFKAKDKSWKEACINSIVGMGTNTYYNGRTTRYNKQVNYNLVNSVFDEKDFLYVTDPWGIGNTYGEAPARMENYNIIRNVVEFLKGDDLRRPFSYTAVAINGEAVSVRQEYKANLLKESLAQYVQAEEAKYGLNQPSVDEEGNPVQPKTPKQIEEYMQYSYKDIVEKQTNDILQYLYKKEDIVKKFVEGWEHGIISGEEIYHVGISYNEPIVRVVNPLYFDYDKNPDVKEIENAQWCREERFMTKGEILDEYREFLSEEDLMLLDQGSVGMNTSINKFEAVAGFSYDYNDFTQNSNFDTNGNKSNYINVNVCCWKTWKKIGFFSYVDPQSQEPVKKIIDEDFKVPNEFKINAIPYEIEWEWINEVWSGVRIGNNIFCNIGPIENQCRTLNNPSLCKLPYVGRIYNSTNSVSVSIVDLLKKYQFFYNTIMYRIELEIAKAQGKKVIIDIAQIPKTDMGLDKWMYYYSNTGIAFINSLEEGRPGDPNSVSKFNQFTSVDMSVGSSLPTYLNILNKIEESVEKVSGISRQRLGDTFSSESATGIQNSVVQSSIITEYMYFNHNNVKKEVLTQLVEAAKIAYQNSKTISYITDDMQRVIFDIDSERLNNSDVGVFISNTTKDLETKQKIEGLLQAAMQNDKISMTDMVQIFQSNSTSELKNIAKGADLRIQQQAEAQQQHEAELQQLAQEHTAQLHADEREDKALDRENKLAVAQIGALGIASKPTPENPDNTEELALQMNEVLSKREEANRKTKLEYDKLVANQVNDEYRLSKESQMQEKELKYKQQELKSKEKIAKMKPKPIKKK